MLCNIFQILNYEELVFSSEQDTVTYMVYIHIDVGSFIFKRPPGDLLAIFYRNGCGKDVDC